MAVKDWAVGVNTKVLRDGTSWGEFAGFISDDTRSGKVKRRLAHSQTKRIFNVAINMTKTEYDLFHTWYVNDLSYGLYAFNFPKIDSEDKSILRPYRFTSDGAPQYSNTGGKIIKVTMQWEEV